jgi:hypothetical protein
MPSSIPFLLLVALPSLSPAADFDARVAAAQAAAATRPGLAYDMAMVPAIHAAVVPCVPAGTDAARGGGFTLVADVDAMGRVRNADVRPASPLARCFAKSFGATRLRAPPLKAQASWPVVVRMQARP